MYGDASNGQVCRPSTLSRVLPALILLTALLSGLLTMRTDAQTVTHMLFDKRSMRHVVGIEHRVDQHWHLPWLARLSFRVDLTIDYQTGAFNATSFIPPEFSCYLRQQSFGMPSTGPLLPHSRIPPTISTESLGPTGRERTVSAIFANIDPTDPLLAPLVFYCDYNALVQVPVSIVVYETDDVVPVTSPAPNEKNQPAQQPTWELISQYHGPGWTAIYDTVNLPLYAELLSGGFGVAITLVELDPAAPILRNDLVIMFPNTVNISTAVCPTLTPTPAQDPSTPVEQLIKLKCHWNFAGAYHKFTLSNIPPLPLPPADPTQSPPVLAQLTFPLSFTAPVAAHTFLQYTFFTDGKNLPTTAAFTTAATSSPPPTLRTQATWIPGPSIPSYLEMLPATNWVEFYPTAAVLVNPTNRPIIDFGSISRSLNFPKPNFFRVAHRLNLNPGEVYQFHAYTSPQFLNHLEFIRCDPSSSDNHLIMLQPTRNPLAFTLSRQVPAPSQDFLYCDFVTSAFSSTLPDPFPTATTHLGFIFPAIGLSQSIPKPFASGPSQPSLRTQALAAFRSIINPPSVSVTPVRYGIGLVGGEPHYVRRLSISLPGLQIDPRLEASMHSEVHRLFATGALDPLGIGARLDTSASLITQPDCSKIMPIVTSNTFPTSTPFLTFPLGESQTTLQWSCPRIDTANNVIYDLIPTDSDFFTSSVPAYMDLSFHIDVFTRTNAATDEYNQMTGQTQPQRDIWFLHPRDPGAPISSFLPLAHVIRLNVKSPSMLLRSPRTGALLSPQIDPLTTPLLDQHIRVEPLSPTLGLCPGVWNWSGTSSENTSRVMMAETCHMPAGTLHPASIYATPHQPQFFPGTTLFVSHDTSLPGTVYVTDNNTLGTTNDWWKVVGRNTTTTTLRYNQAVDASGTTARITLRLGLQTHYDRTRFPSITAGIVRTQLTIDPAYGHLTSTYHFPVHRPQFPARDPLTNFALSFHPPNRHTFNFMAAHSVLPFAFQYDNLARLDITQHANLPAGTVDKVIAISTSSFQVTQTVWPASASTTVEFFAYQKIQESPPLYYHRPTQLLLKQGQFGTLPQDRELISDKFILRVVLPPELYALEADPVRYAYSIPFSIMSACWVRPASLDPLVINNQANWRSRCKNGGRCGFDGTCSCPSAYTGKYCEFLQPAKCSCPTDISPCGVPIWADQACTCPYPPPFPNPKDQSPGTLALAQAVCGPHAFLKVLPNGNCSEWECGKCHGFWAGPRCQTCQLFPNDKAAAPPPPRDPTLAKLPAAWCLNGGRATESCDRCSCPTGFVGALCQCQAVIATFNFTAFSPAIMLYQTVYLPLLRTDSIPDPIPPYLSALQTEYKSVLSDLSSALTAAMSLSGGSTSISVTPYPIHPNQPQDPANLSSFLEPTFTIVKVEIWFGCPQANPLLDQNAVLLRYQRAALHIPHWPFFQHKFQTSTLEATPDPHGSNSFTSSSQMMNTSTSPLRPKVAASALLPIACPLVLITAILILLFNPPL